MSVLWQWLLRPGLERFELLRANDEWTLRGTIVAQSDRGPSVVSYSIVCDREWRTRSANVAIADDSGENAIVIAASDGRWLVNGAHAPQVDGCVDIDLGWSPSTNTLPIRRRNLSVGASSGPLTMAWVRFPELTVEMLPQEYVRLAERRYRYISRGGSFQADLDVDDDGVVIDYEGIWSRHGRPR